MRQDQWIAIMVALLALLKPFPTNSAENGIQPTNTEAPSAHAKSKLYDAFDPGNLAEKHASRFDKTPRNTNVVTNITITPPGDYFKLFRIKGNIPDEGLDDVLSSLRTELSDLAKTSRVKLVHGPKNTMGDRPIQLLSVLFLGDTVELKTLRGFYFTYEDGEIVGAVDTFAIRCVDENTRHWKIVCAVHEAKC